MAKVTLKDLSKQFGSVSAVHSVTLEIEDRAFVCLLGPSGCGKTTTLRLIAGLEKPTKGEIWFDQQRVDSLPANKRDIAMVFQSYALYPHMSVQDNLGFALRMMRVPRHEIRRRVEAVALQLMIDDLLDRKPAELSGGQRQRVALGRAIIRDPAVFLMDEPLSNLDAQLRVQMRVELKRLHAQVGRTFIYVTHDQAEALTMADKIAIMRDGRLLQYGSPDEVYNYPRTLFVASFIGSPPMNFLEGFVERGEDKARFIFADQKVELDGGRVGEIPPGAVILGIRPEDLSLLPSLEGGGLAGSVLVEESLGPDLFVVVDVGQQGRITVRTTPERRYPTGTNVRLVWNPTKLHFFDPESEGSL